MHRKQYSNGTVYSRTFKHYAAVMYKAQHAKDTPHFDRLSSALTVSDYYFVLKRVNFGIFRIVCFQIIKVIINL